MLLCFVEEAALALLDGTMKSGLSAGKRLCAANFGENWMANEKAAQEKVTMLCHVQGT